MKLIVGLGNPGDKYNFTRHNLGFLVLDFYLKVNKINWNAKPRFGAIYTKDGDTIFIKPQEFYNLSGQSVAKFMNYYKITANDVLVICDDFNLEFGKIRYRKSGSAGGNNGLKSVIEQLKTEDFARIRVGTGNTELRKKIGDTEFVLSKFTSDEKAKLVDVLNNTNARIDELL